MLLEYRINRYPAGGNEVNLHDAHFFLLREEYVALIFGNTYTLFAKASANANSMMCQPCGMSHGSLTANEIGRNLFPSGLSMERNRLNRSKVTCIK